MAKKKYIIVQGITNIMTLKLKSLIFLLKILELDDVLPQNAKKRRLEKMKLYYTFSSANIRF